ncbi:MAG: MmgE/PrpD family protein [Gammaproteobacteria bacterium]|nr:MmgE/PrpD family protein [Gammaproteobacteria bacterium]
MAANNENNGTAPDSGQASMIRVGPLLEWLDGIQLAETPQVEEKARLLLVDTLACAVSGLGKTEPAVLAAELARIAPGPVRLPGTEQGLAPSEAAFVLALAACWDEACEGLARAHGRPGLHAVASAAALGSALKSTLGQVLQAIVFGYEIGGRFGEALRIRPGMHVDGGWGSLAGTAAASRLLNANVETTQEALAMAACQMPCSLYLPVAEGSTARNTYAAHAAAMGIIYAKSAIAGVTAPAGAFDAAGALYFDAERTDASSLEATEDFYILEGYLKPYAAVRHVHYGVACAELWRRDNPGTDPGEIDAIELETYEEAATYCGNRRPRTPIQAQFSLTYGLAHALRTGNLTPDAYLPEALQDEEQKALERKIRVTVSPDIRGRGAVLHLRAGAHSQTYRVESVTGDVDRPVSTGQVVAKAREYMAPVIGAEKSRRIIDAVLNNSLDTRFTL